MKTRCTNQKDPHFERYGARWISVCDEWRDDFQAFYNCRWVTVAEQNRNKRNVRFITYNGVTKTIPEWTKELHLGKETIRERLRRGWSETEAIEGKRVMQ